MSRFILTLVLVLLVGSASAQLNFRQKKSAPVFPKDLKHKGVGYFGGVGGTWAYTVFTPEKVPVVDNGVDTSWTIDVTAKGRTGVYFEAGRYHLLEYSVAWRYIDYGMAYKSIRGRETWDENLWVSPYSEPQTIAQG